MNSTTDLERTIYIGNISDDVTEEVLYTVFIPFGEIKHIEIPKDHETGEFRGFGFVEYEELDDLEHAIDNRHSSELFGKVIKVQRAKKLRGPMNKAIWADKDYQIKYIENKNVLDDSEVPATTEQDRMQNEIITEHNNEKIHNV
jgi:peptidyl-prolyl isomerase E (cyclophilin E)